MLHHPETVEKSRVSGFLLPFSTIVSTIIAFFNKLVSRPKRAARAFFDVISILRDQLLQLVRRLPTHILVDVTVHIEGKRNRCVT